MLRNLFTAITVASVARIMITSSLSEVWVDAFSTLPISTPKSSLIDRGHPLSHHPIPKSVTNDQFLSCTKTDGSTAPSRLTGQKEAFQKLSATIRLSMLLLSSSLAIAPSFLVQPASAASSVNDAQGVSVVTQSSLGTSVRSTVVQSAKLVDAIDLKWERLSDSLRDQKKCDPRTNRRLFDNGFKSDGTPRGNPVLGALCEPVPLKNVDETLVDRVLRGSLADAAFETIASGGMDKESLEQLVDKTRLKVRPAFERAVDAKAGADEKSKATGNGSPEAMDEARKQQKYNLEVYARIRAYDEALATSTTATQGSSTSSVDSPSPALSKPPSGVRVARQTGKKLELLWGRNLLDRLAGPSTASYKFTSPFPKPEADIPFSYNVNQLTNALGAIEVALQKLQDGGLIGHWEISIPEDDYGDVVTIAVDDDVCLGAQILAREQNSVLAGSPVVAMVRSAIEDRAKIPYVALDVFFIDPTTTKNELYNPTQLLVSVRNLGEEP